MTTYVPDACACCDPVCLQYGCQRTAKCRPTYTWPVTYPPGCICPPTSERTCENPVCPRKDPNRALTTGTQLLTENKSD